MAKLKSTLTAAALLACLAPTQAPAASKNLLFILDGSNSMWGQVEGVAKIQTAKDVLSELLTGLSPDTSVGLMAYGHRVRDDCSDVETLAPIGALNARDLATRIKNLTPKGKTPIAYSIRSSAANFAGLKEKDNQIVLISDGIESCEGDPCAEAAALARQGVGVKVHVVGFNVEEAAREQLQCIAEKGNGSYFDAQNAEGFQQALREVQHVAAADPAPEPDPVQEPRLVEVFRDNFDTDALGPAWSVENADEDSYIVENGSLSLLSSEETTLYNGHENQKNLIQYKGDLPEGDWTATVRIKTSVATFRELYSLSLYTDKDTFLAGSVFLGVSKHAGNIFLNLLGRKAAKGKHTDFNQALYFSPTKLGHDNVAQKVDAYTAQASAEIAAVLLRMRKTGRSYFIAAKIEPGEKAPDGFEPEWVELNKLTSLRSPGKVLMLSAGQQKFNRKSGHLSGGETLIDIDWFKIEVEK